MTTPQTKIGKGIVVHLAAFGKHPGWDDHIEDIGLSTPELVWARKTLYSEGIAGNIDSATWDRLEDEKRLPQFRHLFFWRISGSWLVGRMWSSKDGKGRAKYPMIVCAQIQGAPGIWAMEAALPILARIEEKVTQTNSAELVRLAIGEGRKELQNAASVATVSSGDEISLLRRLAEHPQLQPGGDPAVGFERVLYEIDREMGQFRRQVLRAARSRTGVESGAQHARFPRCFQRPGEPARAWTALLESEQVDPAVPVLVIEPSDERFVDVLVGDPGVNHLFCVRASEKAISLSSDVPYSINPQFSETARQKQKALRDASDAPVSPSRPFVSPSGPEKKNLTKWIGLGVGAVVVLVILFSLLKGSSKPAPASAEPVDPKSASSAEKPSPAPAVPTKTPDASAEVAKPAPTPPPAQSVDDSAPAYPEGDPRKAWAGPESLRALARELEESRSSFDDSAKEAAKGFERQLSAARTAWLEIRDAQYPAKELAIAAGMRSVDESLTQLTPSLQSIRAGITERARAITAAAESKPPAYAPLAPAFKKAIEKIDVAQGPAKTAEAVNALKSQFDRLSSGLSERAKLPSGLEADLQRLATGELDRLHKDAADLVVAGAEEQDFRKASQAVEDLHLRSQELVDGLALASQVTDMLAQGYGPAEAGPQGTTLDALASRLNKAPGLQNLDGEITPLVEQVQTLKSIASVNEPATLADLVGSGSSAAGLLAFERLAALPWPATVDDCERAAELCTGPVDAMLKQLPEARRSAASRRIQSAKEQMWTRAAGVLGSTPEGVAKVPQLASAFGVSLDQASLPAWMKYNVALKALKEAEPAALNEAFENLLNAANGLEPAARDTVKPIVDALVALKPPPQAPDVKAAGPASAGWTFVEGNAERAVYERAGKGGPARLEFRAVSKGEIVTLVSSVEVSVKAAAAILPEAEKVTPEVAPMIGWTFTGDGNDARSGPRTWTWGPAGAGKEMIPVGNGWLRKRTEGFTPPKGPFWESPVQHIGSPGAMLLARAAGCRLPTVEEWKAAVAAEGAVPEGNLRDAAWSASQQAWRAAAGPDQASPYTASIFLPKSEANDSGVQAVSADDGVVWFEKVDQGGGRVFKHLRGNVAEYVLLSDAERQKVDEAQPDDLRKLRESVGVIGASALSPASIRWDEVQTVKGTSTTKGFSDVGFRLAFQVRAPAGPKELDAQKVKAVVKDALWLKGERP